MDKQRSEGTYEAHWQQREYGHFTWQLYAKEENGQLRLVDMEDFGPFDGKAELQRWLGMRLWRDLGLPFA